MESAAHQSCFDCGLRPDRVFCDLPTDSLTDFDRIKTVSLIPRGTTLFSEGRNPTGAFVLCEGRAKLTVCSEQGKRLVVRIAGPGEVLGLSAAVSGKPYEITAEVIDNARIAFIRRKELLKFLKEHREACLQVVHLLSQDLHTAFDRVRSIGLSRRRRMSHMPARARV